MNKVLLIALLIGSIIGILLGLIKDYQQDKNLSSQAKQSIITANFYNIPINQDSSVKELAGVIDVVNKLKDKEVVLVHGDD